MEKEIEIAFEKLQKTSMGDNEIVHLDYDNLLLAIARKYEPELLAKADALVIGITFWYA